MQNGIEDLSNSSSASKEKENELILRVAIPTRLYQCQWLDYLPPVHYSVEVLQKGMRMLVPVGKKNKVGLLIDTATTSYLPVNRLKRVVSILDKTPFLPPGLLKLMEWMSRYYHSPLGEVFATIVPAPLRNLQTPINLTEYETPLSEAIYSVSKDNPIRLPSLSSAQKTAVTTIEEALNRFQTFLLQGVTGSGKTEVYLQSIARVLLLGRQALLLVPEIGLIPQTLAHCQQRFPAVKISVLHSNLSNRNRLMHWLIAERGQASIIIGTRSGIFAPLLVPGIIILDEEHDKSFKQEQGLRYHARDLAVVRGKIENIPVILGSATPSLESLHNAQRNRYWILDLPTRVGKALAPRFELIDIRNQKLTAGLSATLLKRMQEVLNAGEQVLLFLNRRGFAPVTMCHGCGWAASCHDCEKKLVMHKTPITLQCHYCGRIQDIPTSCPQCQQPKLFSLGQGTQKLEQVLQPYFPGIKIIRLDKDSTQKRGHLETLLKTVICHETRILIGTQMLAKGHHFPNVTLVGIVNADDGLFSYDFHASEHSAQLLTQIAGRAGRLDKLGTVLIQTYHPQHPLLLQLIEKGYGYFSQLALEERKTANWPPYSHLAILHAEAKIPTRAIDCLEKIKAAARPWSSQVKLLGPVPSFLLKRSGRYRFQLLLQANRRQERQALLQKLIPYASNVLNNKRIRWYLDVDPVEIA